MDTEIFNERLRVERKTLLFEFRENPRGRFLRMTEEVGGRRDTIIVPSTGLEQFRTVLDHVIAADKDAGPVRPAEGQ